MKKSSFILLILFLLLGSETTFAELLDTIRPYPMEEVVVMASRLGSSLRDIPQKVEIITKRDIQEVPNDNLAEVVKRLTNLDIVHYPGAIATVGQRGFSPSAFARSYTLLLINGKPAGTNNFAYLIPANIDRIEVIKGPYATLYGSDAMGGVINIITDTLGSELHGKMKLEGGTFGYYRLEGSMSGEILPNLRGGVGISTMKQGKDYLIGGSNLLKMTPVEKLILDRHSYGDTMANTIFDLSLVNARLEWDISQRWHANAEVTYTFGNNIETSGTYWGSYGDSKKQIRRWNAYGTLDRKGQFGVLSFSPYFTRENEPNFSDNTTDGFVNFESEISEYGFQLQQQHSFGNFKTVGGIDVGVFDYHSERFESTGTPIAPYKPDNRHSNGALFIQASYHDGPLDINFGARYDRFWYHMEANDVLHSVASDNTYNTFNPSIGAQYRLLDRLKAHASFGTAFAVPDAYQTAGSYDVSVYFADWDYTWTQSYQGNPDLKPEKSRTIDAGMSFFTQNHAFNSDITYFQTHHDDQIVENRLTNGTITFMNANKSLMNGLEFSAEYDFGSLFNQRFSLKLYSHWTWLFHADYTKSTLSSTGSDSTFCKDLLYVRKLTGNAGLFFQHPKGLSARLSARYNGSRFEDDNFSSLRPDILESDYTTKGGFTPADHVLNYPDFLLFDLNAHYVFPNKLQLGLSVSNLFDENYSDKDGYHMQGRQLKINVGYQF